MSVLENSDELEPEFDFDYKRLEIEFDAEEAAIEARYAPEGARCYDLSVNLDQSQDQIQG